jgi:alkanesulfonate monooxygenase SsuD/methylene tetrahydromethanopterin reductase-like flavin-dependent oxidoreductase (luciferase family)
MAGRGSFIESFPLFGYDLADYDELFAEKLELLLALRGDDPVTWSGKHRAVLENAVVYPRPVQRPLPVWVAVGGNPESAARAGALGLPMALAIIGGMPERFVPFAEVHRRAAAAVGHEQPKLSINSHGYVADTAARAADEFLPAYAEMMTAIGRERGWSPMRRPDFDALARVEEPSSSAAWTRWSRRSSSSTSSSGTTVSSCRRASATSLTTARCGRSSSSGRRWRRLCAPRSGQWTTPPAPDRLVAVVHQGRGLEHYRAARRLFRRRGGTVASAQAAR